jgi:hypothetical protein
VTIGNTIASAVFVAGAEWPAAFPRGREANAALAAAPKEGAAHGR